MGLFDFFAVKRAQKEAKESIEKLSRQQLLQEADISTLKVKIVDLEANMRIFSTKLIKRIGKLPTESEETTEKDKYNGVLAFED